MDWKKGQKVKIIVEGPLPTYRSIEEGIVLEVTNKGVWLDNGVGNDPSGPFNVKTGVHVDSGVVHSRITYRIEID